MTKPFIAIDWGTTSFRAYEVAADGSIRQETSAAEGILAVKDGAFEEALERHLKGWDKSLPLLAAGMITSRQGWIELPYVDCPAGPAELARNLHRHVTASGRSIFFATGLHHASATLGHDVMRSEETQVFGAVSSGASHFITPGTHSKWIDVEDGRITGFATYVTGELFAVLRNHSILGRLMTAEPALNTHFRAGVTRALGEPAGLSHLLFSARSLGLYNDIPGDGLASYMSGLLIGAEVAHALMNRQPGADYMILASPKIGGAYAAAMEVAGATARYGDPLAIVHGLRLIGVAAGVI
ncbi:MAG: 2-dehydro-3-deoxygalactonokinase [Hyphomicrobiales bacterium]